MSTRETLNLRRLLAQLLSVQLFAKAVTLPVTFLTARIVEKDIYGYAHIQMQLFLTLILFFQKEAVRKACQRDIEHGG